LKDLQKTKKNQNPEGRHPRLEELRVASLVEDLVKLVGERNIDPSELTEENLRDMLEQIYKKQPEMERNQERKNRVIQESLKRLKAEKQDK